MGMTGEQAYVLSKKVINEVNNKVSQNTEDIEKIASQQIPESVVSKVVTEYVNNNSGELATKAEVSELKSDLVNVEKGNYEINVPFFPYDVNTDDGTLYNSSSWSTSDKFDVDKINGLTAYLNGASSLYFHKYDADGLTYLGNMYIINDSILNFTDCSFVRFNTRNTNTSIIMIGTKYVNKLDLESDYTKIDSSTFTATAKVDIKFNAVAIDDNYGTEYESSSRKSTGYISTNILQGSIVDMPTDKVVYIYKYDKKKNYLGYTFINGGDELFTENICEYVRLNCSNSTSEIFNIILNNNLITKQSVVNMFAENRELYGGGIVVRLKDISDYGAINTSNGNYTVSSTRKTTVSYLEAIPNDTVSASYSGDTVVVCQYDKNKNFIKAKGIDNNSAITLLSNTKYIKIFGNPNATITFGKMSKIVCSKNKYMDGSTIPFYYKVEINHGVDSDSTNTTIDSTEYYTKGLLRLPPNYKDYGEKVPLIFFAHGSSAMPDIYTTEFNSNPKSLLNLSYLQDEGYAIFDCFGNTNKYGTGGQQMAHPTNMACIKQGIEYVCKHYNVDINSVYAMCKSIGGLHATNMCYETDFHIKACSMLAPELDVTCEGLGNDIFARRSTATELNFSEDVNNVLEETTRGLLVNFSTQYKQYLKDNAQKLMGYNPAWRGLIGINPLELLQYQIDGDLNGLGTKFASMNRICTVPTKIFIAQDDVAVNYEMSRGYIQSIKNCGGVAELRTMPNGTGGHYSVDLDDNALKVSSITTKCGITHTNVPLAYVESVQFLRRYN